MMSKPRDLFSEACSILSKYWGYSSFRPGQWEVIEPVLLGEDVLAILPTGGGKSLCYQVPAIQQEGITLVISPLIALMQDQVTALSARGIPATFINSTLTTREIDQRWTDVEFGRYKLVYLAPERLKSDLFLARGKRLNISLLAVDEAHCISEWGHQFRPSYLEIPDVRSIIGRTPVLAVTATATPQVRKDIVEYLSLQSPRVIVKGFDRPNIIWTLFRSENKRAKVLDVVERVEGTGVLYAATRRSVEEWAEWLQTRDETVARYHGGMKNEQREDQQEAWLTGHKRLMVATNAFGMGIDKPDVRFVIHVDIPASLESYYQEAGRAGRDGKRSYAVLLYRERDESTQRSLIDAGHPEAKETRAVYDAVCTSIQLPIGALPTSPVVVDYSSIQRLTGLSVAKIRTAISLIERHNAWYVQPSYKHIGSIRFLQPAEDIKRYIGTLENRALASFFKNLLRTIHADAFVRWWEFDIRLLEKKIGIKRQRLIKGLLFLQSQSFLDWNAPGQTDRVFFEEPRTQVLPIDDTTVQRARRRAEGRLQDMVRYARSVSCRRHFLLLYFGEASRQTCGSCDMCLGRHEPIVVTPDDEPAIRSILVNMSKEIPRERWEKISEVTDYRIDGLVDWLVQEEYLRVGDPLKDEYSLTSKAWSMLDQWKLST